MATKKFDKEKLLPKKKAIAAGTKSNGKADAEIERKVRALHPQVYGGMRVRVTIDLPQEVYVEMKKTIIDKKQTVRDFFVELAEKELGFKP